MAYNLTGLTSANTTGQLFSAINDMTGSWLGIGFLLVLWVVSFASINDTNRVKLATASFFSTIAGVLFLTIGIITTPVMWIVGFIFALSLVFLYTPQTG